MSALTSFLVGVFNQVGSNLEKLFKVEVKTRVPTAPGKLGKTGPDLENLEKQGVGGQKPGKILQNLEKKIWPHPEKTQELQQKKYLKKNLTQARDSRFFFVWIKVWELLVFCWNFKNVVLI